MKEVKETLYSLCLKGNVNKAYEYLLENECNNEMKKLKRKYYNRFFSGKPVFRYNTKDNWIRGILKVYYEYFILVLTNKESIEDAENYLVNNLYELLPDYKGYLDIDSIEDELAKEFSKRGLNFLGGVTPPFRGPYIWRKEEIAEYEVELPDRKKTVEVHFMSEFLMESWLHFATFGGIGTGGWAANDILYCVKDRYKKVLDKPDFMISYLTHEAQHLADFEDFPSICSIDLEYRAKLVELVYHPLNNKVLMRKFISHADDDRRNPHTYACHLICSNLSQRFFNQVIVEDQKEWDKIHPKVLSKCALILFEEHTKELKADKTHY